MGVCDGARTAEESERLIMREEPKLVADAVDRLNTFIQERSDFRPLIFEDDGDMQCVKMFGSVLWQSEEDERDWNDEEDTPQDIREFLRDRAIVLLDDIRDVDLSSFA